MLRLIRPTCVAVILTAAACFRAQGSEAVSGHAHLEQVSGQFWQRIFNPARPAAPPRLVPVSRGAPAPSRERGKTPVCVRAGEHILLHQSSDAAPVLSLAAVALENAACGMSARVRIMVTGAIAEVIVQRPGQGLLTEARSAWR